MLLSVLNDEINEIGVIGSLFIDPEPVLPRIRATLNENDFALEDSKSVFKAACQLADDGKPVDIVTILDACGVKGSYAKSCMEMTPTAARVDYYIEGLKTESLRRRLMELSDTITDRLYKRDDPEEICGFVADMAEEFRTERKTDIVESTEACTELYEYMAHRKGTPYVSTGFTNLDSMLGGGMVNEGLYILAARPKCGKTTLAVAIAERVAKRGIPVLFVSLEMSKKQITAKRLAAEKNLPYGKILMSDVSQDEAVLSKAVDGFCKLSNRPFKINRCPGASVQDVAAMARSMKGCGLVVIDYLGLIKHAKGRSLYEQVTATSNSLKRLAKTLGIPILCLAQLNREVEGRGQGSRPRMSDLRDSGAIEQDADGVLLLSRDAPSDDATMLVCDVAANRHGKTGTVDFTFYFATSEVFETERKYEE